MHSVVLQVLTSYIGLLQGGNEFWAAARVRRGFVLL
jgi:hypothetical protein